MRYKYTDEDRNNANTSLDHLNILRRRGVLLSVFPVQNCSPILVELNVDYDNLARVDTDGCSRAI